jgi:1-acyl-sn-glycerol-3-phosphate acyltransferase
MKNQRNSLLFLLFRAFIINPVLKIFYRFRIEGIENLPRNGPAVLICKHQFWMDLFAVSSVMNRQMNYVAKKELFENLFGDFKGSILEKTGKIIVPFTSKGLRELGAIPIDRENPEKMLSSFKHIKKVLSGNEFIVLFPEGKTVPGEMGEFRQGLINFFFKLGKRSKNSITFIPVGISYSRKKKFRKELVVKIGKPVQPDFQEENAALMIAGEVENLTDFKLSN